MLRIELTGQAAQRFLLGERLAQSEYERAVGAALADLLPRARAVVAQLDAITARVRGATQDVRETV